MKKSTLKIVLSLFLMISLGVNAQNKLADGIYAEFNTTKGKITCMLEYEKTPMTVANFVGLAEGNFKVFDSLSFTKPYYDGILFHRIIKGFMIQGGCPQGNGTGGAVPRSPCWPPRDRRPGRAGSPTDSGRSSTAPAPRPRP